MPWLEGLVRAKRPVRLPVVLSEVEVRRLLAGLEGVKSPLDRLEQRRADYRIRAAAVHPAGAM